MNDPGTAEPIQEADREVETTLDGQREDAQDRDEEKEEEQHHNYNDPSRWWFASTGCPLIAGTFGPLANAFSICALVENWRVYVPPNGGSEEHGLRISDPTWLLAVNGVSLALALLANLALLLNMANRLRFKIAQPLCIFGFFTAAVLLIGATAEINSTSELHINPSNPASAPGEHALTSPFYYAIQAAILYMIICMLMCWTALGAYKGHYAPEFRLTMAQRTLMLQTMAFVTYLLLGALVFSHVEGWEYTNAVYWADLTLLTIGLGSDFHPETHTGRTLFLFFAIGGIIIIGLVIGSIRTLVLERGKAKLSARMMEKKRRQAIASVDPRKHRIKINRFKTMKFDNDDLDPAKRRQLEFSVMRAVQDCAERDRRWMALAISTTAAMTLWILGAVVFFRAERSQEWSYFETMYFTYTCLLTIGYGDLIPLSNAGRAFFVLWTLLAVPTLTILISDMGDTVVQTFSHITLWIGTITVLPGENSMTASAKKAVKQLDVKGINPKNFKMQETPGFVPQSEKGGPDAMGETEQHDPMMSSISSRLAKHLEDEELDEAQNADDSGDTLERDVHFYHFVLAKEIRNMMADLSASPPVRYDWEDWEYYLKLMGNADERAGNSLDERELVPKPLRMPTAVTGFNTKGQKQQWSWLSNKSPLMDYKSETEWILERLSTTLERELLETRKRMRTKNPAERRRPPVSLEEMMKTGLHHNRARNTSGSDSTSSSADSAANQV